MKPTPKQRSGELKRPVRLLAFGAHPDDIEFGCGGLFAAESQNSRRNHFVVCSRGEAGSNGTPAIRTREARAAAQLLGATIEFAKLGGDAHFEVRPAYAIALAAIIRRLRPEIILAPTLVENQHPDHHRLGRLVRDAARLARYGGLRELKKLKPHAIGHLFYYAVTPEAEPTDLAKILVDISAPTAIKTWTAAMAAHRSQTKTRNYIDFQLARARVHGMRGGVEYAIPLFPNDPMIFPSLDFGCRSARKF